jgi:hypothetical protein
LVSQDLGRLPQKTLQLVPQTEEAGRDYLPTLKV